MQVLRNELIVILEANILALLLDRKNVSLEDYNELVTQYLKGRKLDDQNVYLEKTAKRLFVEDGRLSGEFTFEFEKYEDIGLYRHEGRGPWMYHIGRQGNVSVETFEKSNGSQGTPLMPVIFWPEGTTEFTVTYVMESPDKATRSLLPLFKKFGTD